MKRYPEESRETSVGSNRRQEDGDRQYRDALYELLFVKDVHISGFLVSSWVLGEIAGLLTKRLGWKTGDRKWKEFWSNTYPALRYRCRIVHIELPRFYSNEYKDTLLSFGPADTSSLILCHEEEGTRGIFFTHDGQLAGRAYGMGIMAGDLETIYSSLGIER